MKYGIIVNSRVTEPVTIPTAGASDPLAWLEKQFPGFTGWVLVSDDAVPGATYNGTGSSTNPEIPAPAAVPNNPNNPYFGKKPLLTKDFFGLAGRTLGTRYPRLRNDPAFLWVFDVISKVEVVDVDDAAGQFLAILKYLTETDAQDGEPLMSADDLEHIMAAWR